MQLWFLLQNYNIIDSLENYQFYSFHYMMNTTFNLTNLNYFTLSWVINYKYRYFKSRKSYKMKEGQRLVNSMENYCISYFENFFNIERNWKNLEPSLKYPLLLAFLRRRIRRPFLHFDLRHSCQSLISDKNFVYVKLFTEFYQKGINDNILNSIAVLNTNKNFVEYLDIILQLEYLLANCYIQRTIYLKMITCRIGMTFSKKCKVGTFPYV